MVLLDQLQKNCLIDHNKHLQSTLNALGYNVGHVDGDFAEKTTAGVTKFQKEHHLKEDGIAGPVTRGVLKDATRAVQKQLAGIGLDIGNAGVDGVLGHYTEHGIKQFQKQQGLIEDGVYGPVTRGKMAEFVKGIQKALQEKKILCW